VASELFSSDQPFQLPYDGIWPGFSGGVRMSASTVSLIGRLTLGAQPSFGSGAVIRADGHFVEIGDDFCLGEMSTVHIAHGLHPTIVGDRVAVGRNSVVHACTVGNDCVIEDEVVILDGSVIADGVVVEAGSTVFPRSRLEKGLLYAGSPAKPVRSIEQAERRERDGAVRDATAASLATAGDAGVDPRRGERFGFQAATARLIGQIGAMEGSSIFFGCRLNAAQAEISIGANSNVQDNTVIDASDGPVRLGENTTIGHNVRLNASSIGSHSLIGIGAVIEAGVTVDDDVMVAAGTTTTPGQHLEGGWLWGGRTARKLSMLNEDRRKMMRENIVHYVGYADAFRRAQDELANKGR